VILLQVARVNGRWVILNPEVTHLGYTDDDVTQAEAEVLLFAAVESNVPGVYRIELTLEEARSRRIAEIDARTDELTAGGFAYGPLKFSLSLESQARLQFMYSAKELLGYPVVYNALDDSASVSLGTPEEVALFALTAVGTLRMFLDSGTELKQMVREATTTAEVLAVVDPR